MKKESRIGIRLEEKYRDALVIESEESGMSVSAIIRRIIKKWSEDERKTKRTV